MSLHSYDVHFNSDEIKVLSINKEHMRDHGLNSDDNELPRMETVQAYLETLHDCQNEPNQA